MSASATEPVWTPFTHGYVFWELETAEHHPPGPDDIEGLREWIEEFMQAFADYPDAPESWIDPSVGESFTEALERLLPDHPALPVLKMLLRPV